MSHFVGAGLPAISLAHLDIDKPAPTNQLIIIKFAMWQSFAQMVYEVLVLLNTEPLSLVPH
jgi:hypothetical protein